jgi:hypothetical protein
MHDLGRLFPEQAGDADDFAVPGIQFEKLVDTVHSPHSGCKEQHQGRNVGDTDAAPE